MSVETEIVTAYLERERIDWLEARARDERAAGMSADAKRDREQHMTLINEYLEDLFVAIGHCALPVDNLGISPA